MVMNEYNFYEPDRVYNANQYIANNFTREKHCK